jgi:hypothetical protein
MGDRMISIVLLGVSGACLISAVQLAGGAGGVRGAALPLGLSATLGMLSLALLLGSLRPLPAGARSTPPPAAKTQSLTFFGLFLLYVAAIEPLGFLVASSLSGILVLRITFKEPWWKAALLSVSLAVLGWILFRQFLHVPLPPGSWLRGVIG